MKELYKDLALHESPVDILSCLMGSLLHRLLGSRFFVVVKNKQQKAANLALRLILAAKMEVF